MATGVQSNRAGAGAVIDGVIEEVFLSPRVVDARAFSEFSIELRQLIEGASGEAEALRGAHSAISGIGDTTKKLTSALRQRTEKAESTADRLEAAATRAEAMLARLDASAEQAGKIEAKVQATVDAALARLDEHVITRLQSAKSDLETTGEGVHGRVESAVTEAATQLAALATDAAKRGGSARERLESAVADAKERTATIEDHTAGVAELAEQAGKAKADLAKAVTRANRSATKVTEQAARADEVRATMTAIVLNAAPERPAIDGMLDQIKDAAGATAEIAERVSSPIATERIEALAGEIEALEARLGALREASAAEQVAIGEREAALREAVELPMRELTRRVREADEWLSSLIERVESMRNAG